MWFSIVINQSKQLRYFSELTLGYVHTTMPYWEVFAPARKPYQIGSLLTHKNGDCRAISVTEQCCSALIFTVESHCLLGSVENEALENDPKTKHPKLENGAPKTPKRSTKSRKRSTQNSKPVCPLKTRDSPLSSHQQQESSTITSRMQFKTIQVELRGVANAFPSPLPLAISELRRALGRVSDFNL